MVIHCDTTRYIQEVLEKGEYSFLFKDLVVVDLGCNIGAFSLWIYPQAKEIHAIDISAKNIDNLNKTIKSNKLEKIKTYLLGIAGENRSRNIERRNVDETGGSGGWTLGEFEGEIDGYTLATFMRKNRIEYIDVLKMDIEGAEHEVIMASDFPKDKINTIIGEIHARNEEFKTNLEHLGFRYQEIPGGHFVARR